MTTPDWTPALDLLLRGQPDHCSWCGRPYGQAKTDILVLPSGLGVAVTCCLPCIRADPQQVQLRAKLEQRYGGTFPTFSHSEKGDYV